MQLTLRGDNVKDHDDVYELIATTSAVLRQSVRKLGPGVKHPKPVAEITEALKEAHDCSGTIQVMKEFIRVNGR
jgi:hypothetical protein